MDYIKLGEIKEEASAAAQRLIAQQSRRSQPFRDRFEHTLRVLKWARRIHKMEGGDFEIITFATLFHDTGWSDTVDHALVGAELAENYLMGKGVDPILVGRITSAVRTHNKRQATPENLPIENLIVMDADLLDEVGVTTLVWDAMSTVTEDKPSYRKALEKDLQYYEKAKAKTSFLKTETGRKLYNERMMIWETCLSHFHYELGLSDEFEVNCPDIKS